MSHLTSGFGALCSICYIMGFKTSMCRSLWSWNLYFWLHVTYTLPNSLFFFFFTEILIFHPVWSLDRCLHHFGS